VYNDIGNRLFSRHVIIFILYKMIPVLSFKWFFSHLVNLKFEFPIGKYSKLFQGSTVAC